MKNDTKVLLLNPYLEVFEDDPAGINPVLGLAYLASYLRSKNIEVKIIDIAAEGVNQKIPVGNKVRYGLSEKEIQKKVRNYNPEIVGITCQSTLHAQDAQEVARIVKRANRHILVVLGGAHPSAASEDVLRDSNVDIVVRGEGEVTLWNIVKNYSNRRSFNDIKGISYRKSNKVIHNPDSLQIKDLDILPFPARHLLPMDIYFKETAGGANYNRYDRVITMVTSRGCPGNCIYCAVRTVWGRSWRGRSPRNVVDEMEMLMNDYNIKEIHFVDDSIAVNRNRLEKICDEIIKRRLDIKWTTPNGIAVWMMDEKLLLKMKKAGCYRLTFGLESGSKEILQDFIGKNYDYQKAREIIRFASKIGMWTIGTFIIGFPFETKEQINDTTRFAISTDLDFAVFYIANPFPGTPMYEICKKEGLLPAEGAYEVVRGCQSKLFSHEELISFQQEAFSKFTKSRLTRPWLFWRKLKRVENYLYLLKLSRHLSKIVLNQFQVKDKGIAALWEK